jgi:hypothetical protein
MGTLKAATKNLKTSIGGPGIEGIGVVQQAGITTAGVAFNLTAWQGREILVRVSAEVPWRWSTASAPTSVDVSTTAASAATPDADGAAWFFPGLPNFRDVPRIEDQASGEGVFLIVDPQSGTVDVYIEAVG